MAIALQSRTCPGTLGERMGVPLCLSQNGLGADEFPPSLTASLLSGGLCVCHLKWEGDLGL